MTRAHFIAALGILAMAGLDHLFIHHLPPLVGAIAEEQVRHG